MARILKNEDGIVPLDSDRYDHSLGPPNRPPASNFDKPSKFKVLGVGVSPLQIPQVVLQMQSWIRTRDRCHYIAVTGMHGITEAQHDPQFKLVLNSADLVVPDGMPLSSG
jgi:UDP-N-acetyl-D-mannosaminuronic acid transferase (WecB/TagA/CpsF family)